MGRRHLQSVQVPGAGGGGSAAAGGCGTAWAGGRRTCAGAADAHAAGARGAGAGGTVASLKETGFVPQSAPAVSS
eukprot:gene9497-biopygen10737